MNVYFITANMSYINIDNLCFNGLYYIRILKSYKLSIYTYILYKINKPIYIVFKENTDHY